MKCINCHSEEVDLISSEIDEEQCSHEYECMNCGCIFALDYSIIEKRVVEDLDEEDEDE